MLAPLQAPSAEPLLAQTDEAACGELVTQALTLIADVCIGVGRNEVCYGNPTVSATLNDQSLFFDRPGDIVPVTAIETLNTSSIDPASDEWGVVLMDVTADLPADTEPMRIVLFGGAQLTPTVDEPISALQTCQFTNTSAKAINFRNRPNAAAFVTDVLGVSRSVEVYGQTSDGAWLRSSRGWINASLGDLACDGVSLSTMDEAGASFVAPMQSFTLRVDDQARCESVPSGMLIQTPSGQTASLRVNNVELQVGSTALLRVDEGGCQTIGSLSGSVEVVDAGQPVPVGGQVRIGNRDCLRGYRPSADSLDVTWLDFSERLTRDLDVLEAVETEVWLPTEPTIADFSADGESGDVLFTPNTCLTLTWAVEEAAIVTLNGAVVAPFAQQEVCPTGPITYVLNATPLSAEVNAVSGRLRLIPNADTDTDRDGVPDIEDNCPALFNPSQGDNDGDGIGNVCANLYTDDVDSDGIEDWYDNCPNTFNPDQADADGDGVGDLCVDELELFDSDGDGIEDWYDNCPYAFNPDQADDDLDGFGDLCGLSFSDEDLDGDGVPDVEDNCPFTYNPNQSTDICEEEFYEGIEEFYDDLLVGDEDGDWLYDEWGDGMSDDEYYDDGMGDDEYYDDGISDDEYYDDGMGDDEYYDDGMSDDEYYDDEY